VLGLIEDYKLDKLINGLALQTGNLIEYNELGSLAEFSHPTLKKYLNFLEKTFICGLVCPFFKNKRTEIVKNSKVYFYDTGLRNIIVDDFRKLDARPDAGQLLENAVFCQLAKGGYEFNYWRDKKKNEVDFILNLENRKVLVLEVKRASKINGSASVLNFKKIHLEIEVVFAYSKLKTNQKWSIKDKKLYTGCCVDLRKRFKQHNNNENLSTKGRGPFALVYYEACLNKQDAYAREKYLKTGMGKRYLKNRLKRFLSLAG